MSEPKKYLSVAADQVRAFNHVSRSVGDGWQYPGHAYDAIGNLSYLVGMLGQAIKQSTVPVTHSYKQDRILIDGGGSANAKVAEMRAAREDAVAAAAVLTAAVQRMHNATSPMGMDTSGLPEFDHEDGGV
jgi:hypothetical protein